VQEEEQFFASNGLYMGHFRKTDANDCDKHPTMCYGHVASYPCGWSSYTEAQMYHLKIALKGGGPETNGGYSYEHLKEILLASNATKSNLAIEWFTPTVIGQSLQGTDGELIPVSLPAPTQECMDYRNTLDDVCSPTEAVRLGDPRGVCQDDPEVSFSPTKVQC